MKIEPINVLEVAEYVVAIMDVEKYHLDHLKLQKILYFIEKKYLEIIGTPAFVEDIVAYRYGPVYETVYQKYKNFGEDSILPENKSSNIIENFENKYCEYELLIGNIGILIDELGSMNSVSLMKESHDDFWFDTDQSSPMSKSRIIEKMRERSLAKRKNTQKSY